MSKFVRSSKFRHVFGKACKPEENYSELRPSNNAWDSNLICANPYFFALNWEAGGGGAFAVIPHTQVGKFTAEGPIVNGHSGPVLDTAFNPFNDSLSSASEDCTVKIWSIPEGGLTESLNASHALQTLKGHNRKVGHVTFHPSASNVMTSNSTDLYIKFWDIEKGEEKCSFTGHGANINDQSFNGDGSLLATIGKDKKLIVWDPRQNSQVGEGETHPGVKGSRLVWLPSRDRIFTVGFSKTSTRQYSLMDPRNLATPIAAEDIDSSSGVLMPFWDDDTGVLFLGGKGDGNVRYYEITDDAPYIHYLSEYKTSTPARGMCMVGKRSVNTGLCEIARALKVSPGLVESISFQVPRKADTFQEDLFPDTPGGEPALTAAQWFGGQNSMPRKVSLRDGFVPQDKREFNPVVKVEEEKPMEPREMQARIKQLEDQVAAKDVMILRLQAQIAQLEKK